MELVCTKKIEITELSNGSNEELNLEYYLVEGEANNSVTYGIQINLFKENGDAEKVIVPDVLSTKPSTMELINLLYSNSVTPVSAYDVISDYIA